MRATIQFSQPDKKLDILQKLFSFVKGFKNLRQHILEQGILLEKLNSGEIENVQRALEGMNYLEARVIDNSVRIFVTDGELRALFDLMMPVSRKQNDFSRILWERGFTIEELSQDQAENLGNHLSAIAIVTIGPDVPRTRIYTVSGQIFQEDGAPLCASGFTVCAFDALSANAFVRCGAIGAVQGDGFYRIDYAWRSNGRKGPDLLIRILDPEGSIVAEAGKNPAAIQEFLDITVKTLCIVQGTIRQVNGFLLPHLLVRAFDRDLRSETLLGQAITDAEGSYQITYGTNKLRMKDKADLIVRVFEPSDSEGKEAGDEIGFSEIIFNASLQQVVDLEVEAGKFLGPSEYERYIAALKLLIEGEPVHRLTDEDLSFLGGKTGIPLEHLNYLRLDDQWCFHYAVEPAVIYSLLRQGLPSDPHPLSTEKPACLQEALQASLAQNIAPAALADKVDQVIKPLLSLADSMASDSMVFELERKAK
ncbi:MAG: hypothetical protein ABS69_12855 [Nitrosomonadales bacterium SCN 54-20]|nr:MAG: hypothetical protein ABS69_12855 [Nitrosomonadales bacterium SCN 54-20]